MLKWRSALTAEVRISAHSVDGQGFHLAHQQRPCHIQSPLTVDSDDRAVCVGVPESELPGAVKAVGSVPVPAELCPALAAHAVTLESLAVGRLAVSAGPRRPGSRLIACAAPVRGPVPLAPAGTLIFVTSKMLAVSRVQDSYAPRSAGTAFCWFRFDLTYRSDHHLFAKVVSRPVLVADAARTRISRQVSELGVEPGRISQVQNAVRHVNRVQHVFQFIPVPRKTCCLVDILFFPHNH